MLCEKDKVVSINYILKGDDGAVIDSSEGKGKLEYLHGYNYLLPKLEEMITGKNPGDKFSAVLEAKDAYGEYNPELVFDVPLSNFDTSVPMQVGMAFQAMTENGISIVYVKEIKGDSVTVDANHDLAGKRLHFEIEIDSVRDATEDEIKSGMAGGSSCGGCGGCGGDCGGDCSCGGECDGNCDGGCGGGCGGCK